MKLFKLKYLLLILLLIGIYAGYKLFGPTVHKPEKGFLFVKTGTSMSGLKRQLIDEKIVGSFFWFKVTSRLMAFKKVKPGKYAVPKGMSIFSLVRNLRNGRQQPVNFVVTKIRTKEQLAGRIGKAFECDSLSFISFLNNNDSLVQFSLDTNTAMAAVLPLTYTTYWNTTPGAVFRKFAAAYKQYWTPEREQKAAALGLTPPQVVTLASIIDEESNASAEKGNIASTYLNRLAKGMPLQADPTVKFALKDFGIKRVLRKHLEVVSPYNTYKNRGLPPGPICTPMEKTVEAVLNAPKTDYFYFVANKTFDGTHVFSTNYAEHLVYAKQYQEELNKRFGKITPE